MLDCIRASMRFQTVTVILGLALLIGDLRFASGDSQCGEGAVLFNNECYLIKQGSCSAGSLFIRDKCCRENCVRTCTAENCWHCCEVENSFSPQTAGTSCNPNCCHCFSKCTTTCSQGSCQNCGCSAACNQCCCQSRNCESCSSNSASEPSSCHNCCHNSVCNQGGGCQQTNCATKTPCPQTNCSNCGTGTSCTPVAGQQSNGSNCGTGGGCAQTNCATTTPCQQTNSSNCGTGTTCTQVEGQQQTNCSNSGTGTSGTQSDCKQTNCGGSSASQGGGCSTGPGNVNCPIPPVEPPTQQPATTSPPPATIECPPGTIPMGRSCRPIYCPKGTIMRNNECIVLVCPAGTVWNGQKCSVPEPITHNITFYNTIITQSNETKPALNLNNFNNFTINLPVTINDDSDTNYEGDSDKVSGTDCGVTKDTACTETTTEPLDRPTATNSSKCCTVMTPRTCERRNSRWYCYSRRYQRCGDFCTAPVIYLKPPRVYTRPQYVVVPPLAIDCNSYSNCGHRAGDFDCSGCGVGLMETCSHYCYRYSCPPHSCSFYDQQTYCSTYPGSYGCLEDDGCLDDDWCG